MDIKEIIETEAKKMQSETIQVATTLLYKFAANVVAKTETKIDDMVLPMIYNILDAEGLINKKLLEK